MSDRPSVEVVALAERAAGLNTIVAAFAADPLTRWMMPKADTYLTHAAAVFDAFGGASFDAGTAFQIADFGGAGGGRRGALTGSLSLFACARASRRDREGATIAMGSVTPWA